MMMDRMCVLGGGLQHSHSLLINHWDNQFLAAERKVAGGLIGKTRYSPHIAAGLLEGIDTIYTSRGQVPALVWHIRADQSSIRQKDKRNCVQLWESAGTAAGSERRWTACRFPNQNPDHNTG